MVLPTSTLALAAALALAPAAGAPQTAPPARYQLINLSAENVAYLDEASMGREGSSRDVWMLRVTHAPVTVAGSTFRVSKTLFTLDCQKMSLRNRSFVFWSADGKSERIDFGDRGNTNEAKPGSIGATIADFVCKGTRDAKLAATPTLDEPKAIQAATLFFDKLGK
jgi:hypothetical protein